MLQATSKNALTVIITGQTQTQNNSKQKEQDCLSNSSKDKLDSQFGDANDSFEMVILEQSLTAEQRIPFEIEKRVVQYLKENGVIMKTDPKAKQDLYYMNLKRRQQKRAFTMGGNGIQIQSPNSSQLIGNSRLMVLQNCSIMQRRTPQQSPAISPSIRPIVKCNIKSKFGKKKSHSSQFNSSVEELQPMENNATGELQ